MPRRVSTLAIAVAIVVVRLLATGGGVAAAGAEPAIRAALVRTGVTARTQRTGDAAVRGAEVGAGDVGLIPRAFGLDEPDRALAPAVVLTSLPAAVAPPAPVARARAPPR